MEHLLQLLEQNLLEVIPFNCAVIDRDYNIVLANRLFKDYFGNWKSRKCHEVCKKTDQVCADCRASDVFEKGETIISDESGVNREGRPCHYVVQLTPLKDDNGIVRFVVEMSLDITVGGAFQKEYNLLFERVPCYISIIDRNFNVVRANEKFREKFGDEGRNKCYNLYKKKDTPCSECPAAKTFKDGKEHMAEQSGISKDGELTNYLVTTSPLSKKDEEVSLVIEIATDVTETHKLQREIAYTHDFYSSLIKNSTDAIIAIDKSGKTSIFNPAASELFKWKKESKPQLRDISRLLPDSFFEKSGKNITSPIETYIHDTDDNSLPVRMSMMDLKNINDEIGRAAFIQDLREIKSLEKEKLDAERLGAVGETVAGLAHTIKNLLMGLEGGMYMVDSGLRSGNAERIVSGWDVLQRNFNKTTALVKDFLNFAKGRLPELKLVSPAKLINDIVELYYDAAKQQGVELVAKIDDKIPDAWLDPDGIEACLTNLVSNGIDAAMMGEKSEKTVEMKVLDDGSNLIFEVKDNGTGMDSEVIQKVFTTFFTTKGNKGTGLGLLTTNKIVKEHGGKIEAESNLGSGSVFRMKFPLMILEMLAAESENIQKGRNHEKD